MLKKFHVSIGFIVAIIITSAFAVWINCEAYDYYYHFLGNVTNFVWHHTRTTPGGIDLMDEKNEVNDADIDKIVSEVEECYKTIPELTHDQYEAARCWHQANVDGFHRDWIRIMIVPEWHLACGTTEQVFVCDINDWGCLQKGQVPTPECPCYCRAGIQDTNIVMTTPNLKLLRAELVRISTSCNTVWVEPLVKCAANPS